MIAGKSYVCLFILVLLLASLPASEGRVGAPNNRIVRPIKYTANSRIGDSNIIIPNGGGRKRRVMGSIKKKSTRLLQVDEEENGFGNSTLLSWTDASEDASSFANITFGKMSGSTKKSKSDGKSKSKKSKSKSKSKSATFEPTSVMTEEPTTSPMPTASGPTRRPTPRPTRRPTPRPTRRPTNAPTPTPTTGPVVDTPVPTDSTPETPAPTTPGATPAPPTLAPTIDRGTTLPPSGSSPAPTPTAGTLSPSASTPGPTSSGTPGPTGPTGTTPAPSASTPGPTSTGTPGPTVSSPAPTPAAGTPSPSASTPGPTSTGTPGPTGSSLAPTPAAGTPSPSASTPGPTSTAGTPGPTGSTPAPSASTPGPTGSTQGPTNNFTPGPTSTTGTPAPSPITTTFPTPTRTCTDNPKEYTVNIDVQIRFPNEEFAACDSEEQDRSINDNIQAALNENFATTVSDWEGDVFFGPFVFDPDQEVNNVDPFARRSLIIKGQISARLLQEGTCSERNVECEGDFCRWGCLTAATTDCGTSSLTNWVLLAEDVRERLAGLGFDCLGIPDQLEVVLVVVDPETESPTPTPLPMPTPTASPATPSPTAVDSMQTLAPTMAATTDPPGTPAPSPITTTFPTPTGTCTDNPRDYTVNIDVQIQFMDDEFAACDSEEQDRAINANIQAALNENFATTVSDWEGDAFFGVFKFDPDQEVNNGEAFAGRTLIINGHGGSGRALQEGSCSERNVECNSDFCRWGCVMAATTDCGTSSLTNWVLLAEDVRERLAGLNFDCLGIPDQLEVRLGVEDPEAGTPGPTSVPMPTPTPTVSPATPSPTSVPSTQTLAPTSNTFGPTGTSAPTDGGFPAPPAPTCTDNPQDYTVSIDVQIQFPDDGFAACDSADQERAINANIQAALNENFADAVPDWEGDVFFGMFMFDPDQEVDNTGDPFARRTLLANHDIKWRKLQEGICPGRVDVECEGDLCRLGCLIASTTDCGTSALTNWGRLAEDVRERLAGLEFECLGIPDELEVVLRVQDVDAGAPTGTPAPAPTAGPGVTLAPTDEVSTPSPTASTPGPTGSTTSPSGSTPKPTSTATPAPSSIFTTAPTPTLTCQDNPQDYTVNIDLQIQFLNDEVTECDSAEQDSAINANIQAALNENFVDTVPDWDGDVFFLTFFFDPDQEVNNVGSVGRRTLFSYGGRKLQEATCSERNVECEGDLCRWGCVTAATTDCGTSSLTNWVLLAEDVGERLAGLNFDCLGIPDQLEVRLGVEDPDSGTPTPTPAPAPTAGPGATTAPTDEVSTPAPTAPTTAPTGPGATTAPTDEVSTPSPTASTTAPTGSTISPTLSTPSPTATPAPSSVVTAAPTPTPTCTDNPQDYPVNIDLQIQFPGSGSDSDDEDRDSDSDSDDESPTCSVREDNTITAAIQSALNQNFPTTVPDWQGDAFWGPFVFDPDQEVYSDSDSDSDDRDRNATRRRTLNFGLSQRKLQEGSCSERNVECEGDLCRWGCITAAATDCGTSSITNWVLLAEDVRNSLAELGFDCLGGPEQLEVILIVEDPNAATDTRSGFDDVKEDSKTATGTTRSGFDDVKVLDKLDPNEILLQSEGGAGATMDDRPSRTIHVESRLKAHFYAGHVAEPTEADISGLIPEIIAFLTDQMREDPYFGDDFYSIDISEVSHRYLRDADANTDTFELDFTGNIKVAEDSTLRVKETREALTEYDFKSFIRNYAWKSAPFKHNQFYQTQWVKFITKGGY